MTPSDLSSLINTEAHKILADRQLDVTVLPEQVVVERPRNPEHGDYATNLALQIAKKVGMNPRELASLLVDALSVVVLSSRSRRGPPAGRPSCLWCRRVACCGPPAVAPGCGAGTVGWGCRSGP